MWVFIDITFFFEGEPYLWARLDRKPTKQADKRFKKYQYSQKTFKGILVHVLFNLDFCTIIIFVWLNLHKYYNKQ